jgi:hypothetical protein
MIQRLALSFTAICLLALGSVTMSTESAMTTGPDPSPPTETALAWEQQKWREEYQLRSRELDLKEKEQQRSTLSSPLVIAIIAATLAALGNAVVAGINGRLQRQIEQTRATETLRLEESRSEAGRILEMIKTGEPDKAAGNLKFLVETGLIANADRAAQIRRYLSMREPGTGPFLPAADGRYKFEQSEGLTKPLADTLEKSLNDFIAYLDRLGVTREAETVSIKIVKGDDALYPYYVPATKAIVINQLIAGDVDVPRRAYTHHVLTAVLGEAIGVNAQALEYGLAWYLPCSFADRPIYGEVSARATLPDRTNIADLSEPVDFKPFTQDNELAFSFEVGAAWASLFWEIRARLGQQAADAQIIGAWLKTSASPDGSVPKRFGKALLDAAGTEDARSVVGTILKDRAFPL